MNEDINKNQIRNINTYKMKKARSIIEFKNEKKAITKMKTPNPLYVHDVLKDKPLRSTVI